MVSCERGDNDGPLNSGSEWMMFYSASVAEHCVTPLLAEEDELTQAMPHCTDRSDPIAGLPDGMNETHMLEAPRDVKEDRAARSRYGVE
ncbi:uncharacterized protein RSE6_05420 [Rhynchosporium secalis]|uniref:Uncharacterized protein n=1 Tax=Rhynchosporium secalis TaxID=38038 RepID=A0A1E1M7R8_RHYSE|nr:uncharacterized protein RSE6_05420 [Rhynchosporium secalis]